MQLPANAWPGFVDAFEAPADGLYAFAVYDVNLVPVSSGVYFAVNGFECSPCGGMPTGTSPGQHRNMYLLYLKAGDTISTCGSAAKLAGVRLGDELSE